MENRIIAILGCTASGKGELAREVAARLGGEIVSVDSMKVYRGMDIGTAKPPAADRAAIPHYLIDVADPWESFSAARFVELADAAVMAIHARGRPVIAVGGTVMYFKFFYEGWFEGPNADPEIRADIRRRAEEIGADALHAELAKVDPAAAARIHRNDLRRIERALEVYQLTGRPISAMQTQWDNAQMRRPEWNWCLIGLRRDREEANHRINERVRRMIAAGLEDEARRIWSDPRGVSLQARQAVGYAELFEYFESSAVPSAAGDAPHARHGNQSRDDVIERIKINSRHLAKHQRSWLKRLPGVRWIDLPAGASSAAAINQALP